MRIGIGVDVHRFVDDAITTGAGTETNRVLVLGGVPFPQEKALRGHSDADAVAHAVSDALLGAAGLGDLGSHFPDTDPRWRGVDSLLLLSQCAQIAARAGWRFVNADCTVVAERPKMAPMREEMITRLTNAVGGPVHVKATRPEGLGSLGRVEGIGCIAVALLERADPS